MSPRSIYQESITSFTGATGLEAQMVEQLMRDNSGGVLDHLDSRQFRKLASASLKALRSDAKLNELYKEFVERVNSGR